MLQNQNQQGSDPSGIGSDIGSALLWIASNIDKLLPILIFGGVGISAIAKVMNKVSGQMKSGALGMKTQSLDELIAEAHARRGVKPTASARAAPPIRSLADDLDPRGRPSRNNETAAAAVEVRRALKPRNVPVVALRVAPSKRALGRGRGGLRSAIIAAESLGKPRALTQ
ncbi:MAG: hypothetical protein O2800_07505 [Planctomycetota bacterium]|nr:hypothetical protein [Planctomycetota bacterium]